MAEAKTQVNAASVKAFLDRVEDADKRAFCKTISKMMSAATGKRPKMWGTSIVGFGSYDYTYASGRSGSWPLVGFSPRAANMSLYIMPGFELVLELMKKLGKFKTGKSCLYVKKASDIDLEVLGELIERSVEVMRERYPSASKSSKKKAASKKRTARSQKP